MLDLQTVRPPPRVEHEGRVVCELDASAFFQRADANELLLQDAVRAGLLALEAEDRFDILQRWSSGAELVAKVSSGQLVVPAEMVSVIAAIPAACVVREACRTRRLRRP